MAHPTHIGFRCDFETERRGHEPPGEELIDWLDEALERRGVRILEFDTTDYSYAFDIATARHVFVGMLGHVEGDQWLLFVESVLARWKKLLGISDTAEHIVIIDTIIAVLRSDPRIRDVRLYLHADDWNRGVALPR